MVLSGTASQISILHFSPSTAFHPNSLSNGDGLRRVFCRVEKEVDGGKVQHWKLETLPHHMLNEE